MDATIIGAIIIPISIFILTMVATGVRLIVKFTTYMVNSEAAQRDIADSVKSIEHKVDLAIGEVNKKIESTERVQYDQEIRLVRLETMHRSGNHEHGG